MTKRHALVILGVIIAIVPFTGFPEDARKIIEAISGIMVVVLSYVRCFKIVSKDNDLSTPPQV